MKWGTPIFLIILPIALLVVIALLVWAAFRGRRRLRALADPSLYAHLVPVIPGWKRLVLIGCPLLALAAALLGAARPQLGSRQVQVKRSGIDLVLALDTSASMSAADVVPSRFARARREMIDLIERLRGDRVGLVVFEGTAFMLCPLTIDYGAARMFLDTVEPGMLPIPGSNLAAALRTAVKSFPKEGNRSRAVVILSDGEAADPDLQAAIQEAKEGDVRVYTVGVGTPSGEPIPERDDSGRVTGYKKDRSGQTVLSKLDEATLRQIADATGGDYFPATLGGGEIEAIFKATEGLDQNEVSAGLRTQYEERFQFFAGLAILLLAGFLIVPGGGRKEAWRGRF